MRQLWRRSDDVERELRAYRPRARREFVRALTKRIEREGRATRDVLRAPAVAGLAAAAVLALGTGALAAAGGKSYLGAVTSAVRSVTGSGGGNSINQGKHTICHATGSESNPYVKITPAKSGVFNGHLGGDHQAGEDIIPPFQYDSDRDGTPETYSQNWDAEHQAIFENDCEVPPPQYDGPEELGL